MCLNSGLERQIWKINSMNMASTFHVPVTSQSAGNTTLNVKKTPCPQVVYILSCISRTLGMVKEITFDLIVNKQTKPTKKLNRRKMVGGSYF